MEVGDWGHYLTNSSVPTPPLDCLDCPVMTFAAQGNVSSKKNRDWGIMGTMMAMQCVIYEVRSALNFEDE